jgi:hypothetical protein
MEISLFEPIGFIIGFILTLFVYSYLFIGDKFPYRLAMHILVGVSAAYTSIVVGQKILVPLYELIVSGATGPEIAYWLVPVFMVLLLLLRRLRAASWIGNATIAFLVSIGAALAVLGALTGTLWPQITQTAHTEPLLNLVVAVLTILTLLSFQFTSLRPSPTAVWQAPIWQRAVVAGGRVVLMITFGTLFASVLSTSLVLLAARLSFFIAGFIELLQQ